MRARRQEVDPEVYSEARSAIRGQLESSVNEIDAQELVCEELYQRFEHYSWVGIYVVEGDELVLSAWAGEEETEHTTIKVGEGICGLAAATGRTEIVPDVTEREEFIACFPSTRSEIVVPILGPAGVRGEIDIDDQTTSAYGPAVEKIAEDGSAVPLMAFGQIDESGQVVRDPNFPDMPTVVEVYEQLNGEAPSGEKFEAYKKMLELTYTFQKSMWVPHDTPPEAVALLRESADELGKSAEFQEAAADVLGGYPLLADEQLAESVSNSYTVDPEVRKYLVDLLHTDYQVELD